MAQASNSSDSERAYTGASSSIQGTAEQLRVMLKQAGLDIFPTQWEAIILAVIVENAVQCRLTLAHILEHVAERVSSSHDFSLIERARDVVLDHVVVDGEVVMREKT
jgi:hypothetical protein